MRGEVSFISTPTFSLPASLFPLSHCISIRATIDVLFRSDGFWVLSAEGEEELKSHQVEKGKFWSPAVTSAARDQPEQARRCDACVVLLPCQCEACVVVLRLLNETNSQLVSQLDSGKISDH